MSAAEKYISELRENRPVAYHGLDIYPLTVADYSLFVYAKPAMELLQSELSPQLARLTWFDCLWAMDAQTGGKKPGSLVQSILLLLNTALRLEADKFPERLKILSEKDGKIKEVIIDGGKGAKATLTCADMSEIREILALQNGYRVPDENWNPELLQAERYLAGRNTGDLDTSLEALVYSVAANMNCRASQVWRWPLKEFFMTQKAIDRRLGYCLCTMAEMTGAVKFKKGNPFPTWKFDLKGELPNGFKNLADLETGTQGLLTNKTKGDN